GRRHRRRGHRAPCRLGLAAAGARALARTRRRRRGARDADHQPLLLQVDLLPRAERRPLRDRDDRPRLRDRRADRAPRRAAVAATRLRALTLAGRAGPDAATEPARDRRDAVSGLDSLAYRLRPAAGEAEGALVLFHGRGADENDLFPVLDFLDPERRLVAATPRGPLSLLPGGAHWYVVREIGFPDKKTFDASCELAREWLTAFAQQTGVPAAMIVLGGCS